MELYAIKWISFGFENIDEFVSFGIKSCRHETELRAQCRRGLERLLVQTVDVEMGSNGFFGESLLGPAGDSPEEATFFRRLRFELRRHRHILTAVAFLKHILFLGEDGDLFKA